MNPPQGQNRPGSVLLRIASLCAAFTLLRILWLTRFNLNGDEAVFGLMAMAIGRGEEYPLYCWGAHYASALTSYLALPFMALLGPSSFALKLSTIPWGLGLVALVYLLVRRRDGPEAAFLDALTIVLPVPVFLMYSVAANGGYPESYFLGFAVWAACLGALERPTLARYLFVGFLGGLSFAVHPLGVPFIVSALITLVVRREATPCRGFRTVAAGLVLGAAPILYYNIFLAPGATVMRFGARSLAAGRETGVVEALLGRARNLPGFLTETAASLEQVFVLPLSLLPAILFAAAVVWGSLRLIRKKDPAGMLTLSLLLFLPLWNLAGNLARDRFWTVMLPAVALAWPALPRAAARTAFAVLIALGAYGSVHAIFTSIPDARPARVAALAEDNQCDGLIAGYNLGYQAGFYAEGRIPVAAIAPPDPNDRKPSWTAQVAAGRHPAVMLPDDGTARSYEENLLQEGVGFQREVVEDLVVIFPDTTGAAAMRLLAMTSPASREPSSEK